MGQVKRNYQSNFLANSEGHFELLVTCEKEKWYRPKHWTNSLSQNCWDTLLPSRLPFQCWCTRFGELTKINNIERKKRVRRKQRSVEVSQLFLSAFAESQAPQQTNSGRVRDQPGMPVPEEICLYVDTVCEYFVERSIHLIEDHKRPMITPEAWTPVIIDVFVCMYVYHRIKAGRNPVPYQSHVFGSDEYKCKWR